jgi:hypothetical protein
LLEIPLLPLVIPGFINLAPSFRLMAGINVETYTEMQTRFGLNFTVPIDLEIYSPEGMLHPPKYTNKGHSEIKPHKMGKIMGGGRVWYAFHFYPVTLTLTLRKLYLTLDSSIGDLTSSQANPLRLITL